MSSVSPVVSVAVPVVESWANAVDEAWPLPFLSCPARSRSRSPSRSPSPVADAAPAPAPAPAALERRETEKEAAARVVRAILEDEAKHTAKAMRIAEAVTRENLRALKAIEKAEASGNAVLVGLEKSYTKSVIARICGNGGTKTELRRLEYLAELAITDHLTDHLAPLDRSPVAPAPAPAAPLVAVVTRDEICQQLRTALVKLRDIEKSASYETAEAKAKAEKEAEAEVLRRRKEYDWLEALTKAMAKAKLDDWKVGDWLRAGTKMNVHARVCFEEHACVQEPIILNVEEDALVQELRERVNEYDVQMSFLASRMGKSSGDDSRLLPRIMTYLAQQTRPKEAAAATAPRKTSSLCVAPK